jgi:hypothetical protein
MPRKWPSLRRRPLVVGVAVVIIVVLVTLGTVRYTRLYDDLTDGKALLIAAAALMEDRGLNIESNELDDVEVSFQRAQNKLESAANTLDSDPLLFVARHLPWLGDQVEASRDLVEIGADGSDIGLEAVRAMRSYHNVRDSQGGALSEKVTLVLDAVGPHVQVIEEELAAVDRRRQSMPEDGLLDPLDSALGDLDYHIEELRARLEDYRRGARLAPELLGHDGSQTYLVLAHDNTEMLGSGGFILVYGLLTIDHGRLERLFFDDVGGIYFDWRERTGEYIEPPRPLKAYLLRDWSMGLGEASWWPDFPTVAEEAIDLYRREAGSEEPIDGVIGINFFTLEKLLEVTGPVMVEQYGVTVDSHNVTEQTLIITHPEALRPWESDRYDFIAYLAEGVIDRALGIDSSRWAPMLTALHTLGQERNLLLYSHDEEVQEVIAEQGWDGRVMPASGDYLMVVDSSLNSTKLNLVVEPSIQVDISLDDLGNARNTVTIAYANDYTTWAQGVDPHLASLVVGAGTLTVYGNYVRLLVPEGSTVQDVREQGTPVGTEAVWQEHGKTVLGRYFALTQDATKTLSFTYLVPSALDTSQNPFTYSLVVQKQPGTAGIPLKIRVEPPNWAEAVALELDGALVEASSLEVSTDLRIDRTLVVTAVPQQSDIPRWSEQ